jgi:hypothetical protein
VCRVKSCDMRVSGSILPGPSSPNIPGKICLGSRPGVDADRNGALSEWALAWMVRRNVMLRAKAIRNHMANMELYSVRRDLGIGRDKLSAGFQEVI